MESRQVRRAEARREAKEARSRMKALQHMEAGRALRERTRRREYNNPFPLYAVMKGSRSRVEKRKVQKGRPFGRILFEVGEAAYHATKGWRAA